MSTYQPVPWRLLGEPVVEEIGASFIEEVTARFRGRVDRLVLHDVVRPPWAPLLGARVVLRITDPTTEALSPHAWRDVGLEHHWTRVLRGEAFGTPVATRHLVQVWSGTPLDPPVPTHGPGAKAKEPVLWDGSILGGLGAPVDRDLPAVHTAIAGPHVPLMHGFFTALPRHPIDFGESGKGILSEPGDGTLRVLGLTEILTLLGYPPGAVSAWNELGALLPVPVARALLQATIAT